MANEILVIVTDEKHPEAGSYLTREKSGRIVSLNTYGSRRKDFVTKYHYAGSKMRILRKRDDK